jgi:hypothetical protein
MNGSEFSRPGVDMALSRAVNACKCPRCLAGEDHPDRRHHEYMNLLMATLDHQQRRVYAAIESIRAGRGGVRLVSSITGLSMHTIGVARGELPWSRSWPRRRPAIR